MKKFTEYLEDFSFDDLVALWNEYASENSMDDYIYDSVEDVAEATGMEGVELARAVFYGNVKSWNYPVFLNGYANLETLDNDNSPIDIGVLAQWMRDTNHQEWKEWLDNLEAYDFANWLGGELTNEELTELWSEYIQEVDEDDLEVNGLPLNFDIEDLARELMVDWHQHFDDFIEANI